MKHLIIKNLLRAGFLLVAYWILLYLTADLGLISSILCPGPHLPFYTLPVVLLFFCLRIYVVFLPAVLLSRIVFELLKTRNIVPEK